MRIEVIEWYENGECSWHVEEWRQVIKDGDEDFPTIVYPIAVCSSEEAAEKIKSAILENAKRTGD